MDKTEIAASLRKEIGELEVTIKKVQARCDRLKKFVLDLEAEIAGPTAQTIENSKLRKMIDTVFGEKPKRRAR